MFQKFLLHTSNREIEQNAEIEYLGRQNAENEHL
jgi:hypothetical protein